MLENINNKDIEKEVLSSDKKDTESKYESKVSEVKKTEDVAVKEDAATTIKVKVEEQPKTKEPEVKKAPALKEKVKTRVVYSLKAGNLPGFGPITKGYSEIDKDKAKELVEKYSFIRYASEEEISIYVN